MVDETWTTTAAVAACGVVLILSAPFLKKIALKVQDYAFGGTIEYGPHRGMRLPHGSMGLPMLGESLTLKSQRQKFWTSRQHMYGDVFKTHLFGYPSIVVAGPEAARFVMVDQASSFRQRGLPMIEKLLGFSFFGYQHEKVHGNFRKILHGPLLPESLERSISIVEAIAIDILKEWDGKTVNTLEEAKKVAMEFVIGAAPQLEKEELTRACEHLIRGVSSLPINVPGTNYYKTLKAEHEMISGKKSYDENIKWYDIKEQMQLTLRVVKETLRIANVVEFSYREALEEVPYKGIVFPKGWRVIVAHAAYHMNSKYFPRPQEFDSSRFRVHPKLFTFTPFGSGSHACMGRELVHLQLLVFIHHLVLKYSWEQHGDEDGSEFTPVHVPKGGFPVHVKRRGKRQSFEGRWKQESGN
ncbi:hypothetical protein L7F22_063529 [Adiantum nelumboides]|nr:hypothetical protein [Adiantum nelumboides]